VGRKDTTVPQKAIGDQEPVVQPLFPHSRRPDTFPPSHPLVSDTGTYLIVHTVSLPLCYAFEYTPVHDHISTSPKMKRKARDKQGGNVYNIRREREAAAAAAAAQVRHRGH
jgi:hypothetical protein